MVDRSDTGSTTRTFTVTIIASIVIVAACVGGAFAAGRLPELTERFTTVESAPTTSTTLPLAVERSVEGSTALWQWSGASAGPARTVYLTIDPLVYPTDGIRWYFNGILDRSDIYGPLDREFGLWHSSTRPLEVGDVVSACWTGRDRVARCPRVVVT